MFLLLKLGNAKSLKNTTATIVNVALKTLKIICTFLLPKHRKSKCGLQCISRQNTDPIPTIACNVTMQPC